VQHSSINKIASSVDSHLFDVVSSSKNAVLPKCGEPIIFRIIRAYVMEGPRSKHAKCITANREHLLDLMKTELNVHATNEKVRNKQQVKIPFPVLIRD
jgi:hypothetical protein